MKIGICNDHAGVDYKKRLMEYLTEKGYEMVNFGTDTAESMDYPDVAHRLATAVENGEVELFQLAAGEDVLLRLTENLDDAPEVEPDKGQEHQQRHNDAPGGSSQEGEEHNAEGKNDDQQIHLVMVHFQGIPESSADCLFVHGKPPYPMTTTEPVSSL